MLIGYARVSTNQQDLSLQAEELTKAGCHRLFQEKITGSLRLRPQLERLLDQIRSKDVVVVMRLDRLARSTTDLLAIADLLRERGAGLRSVREPWADTTSPSGRMILTVFAGLAEFERELIKERTKAGRTAAQAQGVRFGRPTKLTTDQVALGRRLIEEGESARTVARSILKCHPATLYRELGKLRATSPSTHPHT